MKENQMFNTFFMPFPHRIVPLKTKDLENLLDDL